MNSERARRGAVLPEQVGGRYLIEMVQARVERPVLVRNLST